MNTHHLKPPSPEERNADLSSDAKELDVEVRWKMNSMPQGLQGTPETP